MRVAEFTIPIKTVNPNNNSQGVTRGGMYARSRSKREQRGLTTMVLAQAGPRLRRLLAEHGGLVVTLVRIAPSAGLDPDDNLPASQKWIKDGIADVLGLKTDRDPRISWKYGQARGPTGDYATKVTIALRGTP